jgi:hypothetical protein
MRPHLFETIGGLALVALSLIAMPATAQTVISNETLVTTTFVVNKTAATARCFRAGCRAKTQMFAPIPVTCPAAMGQTCTFHISLDAKTAVVIPPACNCFGGGPTGFYEFLIDGVAPTIGPTDENGDYIFVKNGFTSFQFEFRPAELPRFSADHRDQFQFEQSHSCRQCWLFGYQ